MLDRGADVKDTNNEHEDVLAIAQKMHPHNGELRALLKDALDKAREQKEEKRAFAADES